jgi:A/G-specific adenine glycosylase
MLAPARADAIRARLLAWYRAARRDLPWRRTRDPYRIWLSEVMLQQTRVEAAIPYYERFLARWPTLAALAAAPEDDVLAAWAGLGYYARARNFVAAVRECAARYGGAVPEDEAAFRALRGVGAYTTGAVLSIAYGRAIPAVDGNVVRVLARLERIEDDPARPATRRRIEALAAALVPAGAASDWNQAVMELGALVCVPQEPRCDACPLAELCIAKHSSMQSTLPRKVKKKPSPEAAVSVAVVVRGGRLLLERRPAKGLLAAMWAPPAVEGDARALAKACAVRVGEPLAAWRHAFTHRVWNLAAYRCEPSGPAPGAAPRRLVPLAELGAAGVPTAFRPALAAASSAGSS